ncbi:transposase [Streptomyces variegatus]|uniref:transposase n=1 Tax=Streptomyces variegatus TaxID=284040 RepID=UPI003C2AAE63
MDGSHIRAKKKGGAGTGPSPVDRRKTGSKHTLICDGRGTPFKVITTAANVNDVTQTLALIDGIPPVAGRPGRPRRRPEALLGDKGYDSNPNRDELRRRRILPVISRKAPQHPGHGQAPLRRRADLRPAPPLQTARRAMGTPHRTPRRVRIPRLQPHLLEAAQEAPIMIVLRALGTERERGRRLEGTWILTSRGIRPAPQRSVSMPCAMHWPQDARRHGVPASCARKRRSGVRRCPHLMPWAP